MLGFRRIALRVLKAPSPSFAIRCPTRSIVSLGPSRLLQPRPVVSQAITRRWASEEARSTPEAEDEAAAPLRSAPLPEELEQEAEGGSYRAPPARQPILSQRDDVQPTNVVYVGNLFYDITEADLQREFEKIGPVKSCKVIFDRRGLSKGFGYVEYETVEEANRAIERMNQQVFEGRRMLVNYQIMHPTPRRPARASSSEPSRTLFIGNMSYQMTDQDLNDLFREISNVIDVRVAIDRRTGTPKGFAHADFVDVQSAENAMRVLEQKKPYGRQLRIDFSLPSSPKHASPAQTTPELD